VARLSPAVAWLLLGSIRAGHRDRCRLFPHRQAVIKQLLADHALAPGDVDVVVPTGVSRSSWEILLRLVGIPEDRLHQGLPSFGHTITSDSFIYLQDLRHGGRVQRGSRLLLFTYGFGSSWCALLLEH
jgi:3-oxoacyl-[acyl-carrier-protein] synthase III